MVKTSSTDPETARRSTILVKIIWAVLILFSVTFTIAMFKQPLFFRRYLLILGIIWPVSLTLLLLLKRGYVRLSAYSFVSFLLLMILLFSISGGGIRSHGIRLLPIVVLISGLTIGRKEVWFFGIFAGLGGLVLAIADEYGVLPFREPIGNSALIHWIYSLNSIFILCYLEYLSVSGLQKSLAETKEQLRLRMISEEKLKLQNQQLRDIAFLQSHMVRRPVANVLGLINIINFENPKDESNVEVIQKLKIASEELDAVIHDIVRKTNEIEERG